MKLPRTYARFGGFNGGLDDGRGLGVRSADADIREFTAGSSLRADVGIGAPQLRQPKIREPERGCVVLDQPQRVARSKVLRLVFDTAALRPRTGRFANPTARFHARAFAMTWPATSVRRSSRP